MSQDYPSNWDTLRKDIYQHDDYKCQDCGDRGGPYGSTELHAHHIVPLSVGGTNEKNNLITVCSSCHSNLHSSNSSPSAITHNKKGYLHNEAEKGINSEMNGCPKCDEWQLSVQWYRDGPLKKAKLITCENCRTLFKEAVLSTDSSSEYKLREVDGVSDVPAVSSAVIYELKKHYKLGNLRIN